MKKVLIFIFVAFLSFSNENCIIVYIPGMFDNGDLMTKENIFIKNFEKPIGNSSSVINTSSSIVGSKYSNISIFNVIGDFRTNIPLTLMSERVFVLLKGYSPNNKSVNSIMKYKGMDWNGFIEIQGNKIYYYGLIEELFVKYGKKIYIKKSSKDRDGYIISNNRKYDKIVENQNGIFENIDSVKVDIVSHSSGGLAIRKYLEYCSKLSINHNINSITFLSVPQKGARLLYNLKDGFPRLIEKSINKMVSKKDSGFVTFKRGNKLYKYNYKELFEKTKVEFLGSKNGEFLRKIIGDYILYFIPFDGRKNVLGFDPALYDLHPEHRFLKELNKKSIDNNIKYIVYSVEKPYSELYQNLSDALLLKRSDGAVEYEDTLLDHIPNYKELNIKLHSVEKANHLPLPKIKPLMELEKTVEKNYSILSLTLKKQTKRDEGINLVLAVMYSIMNEMGLNLDEYFEKWDYSIIDYFGENPELYSSLLN